MVRVSRRDFLTGVGSVIALGATGTVSRLWPQSSGTVVAWSDGLYTFRDRPNGTGERRAWAPGEQERFWHEFRGEAARAARATGVPVTWRDGFPGVSAVMLWAGQPIEFLGYHQTDVGESGVHLLKRCPMHWIPGEDAPCEVSWWDGPDWSAWHMLHRPGRGLA